MVLRYWFIYIFDIKTINITFSIRKFSLITIFTLVYSFSCFFYKNLITLLISKPCRGKTANSREKIGGCSNSSRSFMCLIYDWPHNCSDQGGDEIIRWLTTEVWHYFHNNMYVSGPIFVKTSNKFNPSCLSTTFLSKKVSPIEHMKLKGSFIKLV